MPMPDPDDERSGRQPSIDIVARRARDEAPVIAIIGPGGAGKSTLGRHLAPLLQRALIDLDERFCARIGPIDSIIRDSGYAAYKRANAALAQALVAEAAEPALLVTSSGFLARDNPPNALAANQALLAQCYSISLLPHADLDRASAIIVERQMARGFAKDRAREDRIIRERFALYAAAGDMRVIADAPPQQIAAALLVWLGRTAP
jgi:shikimate kinase